MIDTFSLEWGNLVKRRYSSIINRCKVLGIMPPNMDDIWETLNGNQFNNNGKCEYCSTILKSKDKFPYLDVISIDHKVPLSRGGTTKQSNMAVVCMRCNLVKGTLDSDTYIKLLNILNLPENKELKIQYFDQIISYALANKIGRVKLENGL